MESQEIYDIPKDKLIIKYQLEKKGIYTIAKEYGCAQGTIEKRMKKYGIVRRTLVEGRTQGMLTRWNNPQHKKQLYDAYRKHWEVSLPISSSLMEVLIGELLGDGCIHYRTMNNANVSNNARFVYGSSKQEHVEYLRDLIIKEIPCSRIKIYNRKCSISKYGTITTAHLFSTISTKELYNLYKKYYPKGKKIVPKDLILTPTIVKHWYIGDGSLIKQTNCNSYYATIATMGFPYEDCLFLVGLLKSTLNIETWLNKRNIIYIPDKSISKFLIYIGDCPVDCYKYKWRYLN